MRHLTKISGEDPAGVDVAVALLHAGANAKAAGDQLGRELGPGSVGVGNSHGDARRANAGQVRGPGRDELHLGHGASGLQELDGAAADDRLARVEQGGEKLGYLGVALGGGGIVNARLVRGLVALPRHDLDAGALGVGAKQRQALAAHLAGRPLAHLQADVDPPACGHAHQELALGARKSEVPAGHQGGLLLLSGGNHNRQAVKDLGGLDVVLAPQKAAVGPGHADRRDLRDAEARRRANGLLGMARLVERQPRKGAARQARDDVDGSRVVAHLSHKAGRHRAHGSAYQ